MLDAPFPDPLRGGICLERTGSGQYTTYDIVTLTARRQDPTVANGPFVGQRDSRYLSDIVGMVAMSDVVYTTVPGKIPTLLSKIKQVGVPAKVTNSWLKTIGFTSSNDGSLIPILRISGLIDIGGTPTERWSKFRGAQGKLALGEGIRQGYSDLYAVYPDAHLRSSTDLEHVFSSSSKAGRQAIQKAVSTFKNLAAEAEFANGAVEDETHFEAEMLHAPVANPKTVTKAGNNLNAPSLHIDIQVHVSSEASSEQIDQIFASMAKHLYGRN